MVSGIVEYRSAERSGGLRLVRAHRREKFAPDQILGASAKHHCLVTHRVGCLPMQSLQTRGGVEGAAIVAGRQTDLRTCPQKAKGHGPLDAAERRAFPCTPPTLLSMFRQPPSPI